MKVVQAKEDDGKVAFDDLKNGDTYQTGNGTEDSVFMKTGKVSVVSLKTGSYFEKSSSVGKRVYKVKAEVHLL